MGEHAIVIVIRRITPNWTGGERQMGHYFIVLIRASQISNSPVETIEIQKSSPAAYLTSIRGIGEVKFYMLQACMQRNFLQNPKNSVSFRRFQTLIS